MLPEIRLNRNVRHRNGTEINPLWTPLGGAVSAAKGLDRKALRPMSNLPIHAAAERLDTGFLGEQHRRALRRLLTITDEATRSGAFLPTAVLAAFVAAVDILGNDLPAGGAR